MGILLITFGSFCRKIPEDIVATSEIARGDPSNFSFGRLLSPNMRTRFRWSFSDVDRLRLGIKPTNLPDHVSLYIGYRHKLDLMQM